MEQWTSTIDTAQAAAFATLGMPVKVSREVMAGQPGQTTRFLVALTDVDGKFSTKKLQGALRCGKLAATEPDHPLLVILDAFATRARILDFLNQGTGMERRAVGRHFRMEAARTRTALPGVRDGMAILRTGDLKLVCALLVTGCDLLAVEGSAHQRVFSVSALGADVDGTGPARAPELMAAWRADPEAVPWEHPFAQAMRGLRTRERLLDAVNRSGVQVTLSHPRGGRHAVVSADAAGAIRPRVMDGVRRFFSS